MSALSANHAIRQRPGICPECGCAAPSLTEDAIRAYEDEHCFGTSDNETCLLTCDPCMVRYFVVEGWDRGMFEKYTPDLLPVYDTQTGGGA